MESMENTKIQSTTNPDELLKALYWIWDVFDRCNVPFFLVNQTAKDVIAQRDLTGNKIEVGIRRNEWVSGGKRLIDAFATPTSETDNGATYQFEGVPIFLYVYDTSDCIEQTDMVRYKYEQFKVPNPYSKFIEIYG
jgi:hypothetical protein